MSQELFVTKFYVNLITENLKKRENLLSVSKSFRFTIKNSELNAKKKYQTHKKKQLQTQLQLTEIEQTLTANDDEASNSHMEIADLFEQTILLT